MCFNTQKRVLLFLKLRWYQASGGARRYAAPGPFSRPDAVFFQDNSDGRPGLSPTQDLAPLTHSGYVLSLLGDLFQHIPTCQHSAEISFRSIGIRSFLSLRHTFAYWHFGHPLLLFPFPFDFHLYGVTFIQGYISLGSA